MAAFPKLKTGAVAQYPAVRNIRFQNQTVRFVGGRQQRYRDSAGPLHGWDIQLSQLDEGELAALEDFFVECQGRFGSFEFTDPWDGRVYSSCSLLSDDLESTGAEEMRNLTRIRIVENR
jgi:hypothetical protein